MAVDDVWTVGRAFGWVERYLASKGDAQPRVSAQWLMCHATGLSKVELVLNADDVMAQPELDCLHQAVVRRVKGEPLQYISGTCAFRYLELKVRPGVLIPRPETEVLVSEALKLLPAYRATAYFSEGAEGYAQAAQAAIDDEIARAREEGESLSPAEEAQVREELTRRLAANTVQSAQQQEHLLVADIATGSGCIACAIASEHPRTRVIATDISAQALDLARENVSDQGLCERIELYAGDLGQAVPSGYVGVLDLVVSNPPYVPTAVMRDIPREVAEYEPDLALDGGPDGLGPFRSIAAFAARALRPGGGLACELHETCLEEAARIAEGEGFEQVRIVADLAGRPRVLTARKAAC